MVRLMLQQPDMPHRLVPLLGSTGCIPLGRERPLQHQWQTWEGYSHY